MEGKLCIVTGATDGIGLVTARELAARGAQVVLVGRDDAKGARRVAELRESSGNDRIEFQRADLSRQDEVRRLARNVAEAHAHVDVLVNNVGAIFTKRRLSADGIEATLALNHLSYFLLTHLLLDRLRAAPAGRIVNVASRAHEGASIDFDDLQNERSYSGWRAYQRSKLMNIMFTYALARRLDGSGVTVNALHPGFVASRFGLNNGLLFRLAMRLAFTTAIGVEEGSQTSIHLASAPEVEGVSGRYFVRCRPAESSPQSRERVAQERLWQESLRLTGLHEAGSADVGGPAG